MRIGSLFSGAAGLDRAVQEVFGGEVVWHSEIDKAASKVLAHRFPGVPNLGDITAIDWNTVEPIDILCGGFPCTDVSAAGKRAGMHGTRSGLWTEFAKAIDNLRPRMVVIENVRGLLSAHANRPMESDNVSLGDGGTVPVLRAAGAVLGDLSDIGYDAAWTTLAAGDVGAPHRRERVFIVATDTTLGGRHARLTESEGLRRQPVLGSSGHRFATDTGNDGRPGEADYARGRESDVAGRSRGSEPGGREATFVGGPQSPVALFPTPRSQNGEERNSNIWKRPLNQPQNLENALARLPGVRELLPTPTAQAAKHAGDSRFGGGNGDGSNLWQIHHLLGGCDECGSLIEPLKPASEGGRFCNACLIWLKQEEPPLDLTGPLRAQGKADVTGKPPTSGPVSQIVWGKYKPAIRRWEKLTRPAPAPTEPNKNGNPRLSAAFSEWLMGWPAGWVTDPAIGISRNDQLRIVGNGVCPQQAAAAMRQLLAAAC
jgi:DNA (cytosine-5)-methyltransferase 1